MAAGDLEAKLAAASAGGGGLASSGGSGGEGKGKGATASNKRKGGRGRHGRRHMEEEGEECPPLVITETDEDPWDEEASMTQKVRGEKASEQRARTRGDEKAVARKGTKPKAKATPKAKAPCAGPCA